MKKELSFNEMFSCLEALKTINVKGFKLNYAIDKNIKPMQEEMKRFQELLEKEKPEGELEGKELEDWNKKVEEFASETVEIDIYQANSDQVPDDIDTKTYRVISLFIAD